MAIRDTLRALALTAAFAATACASAPRAEPEPIPADPTTNLAPEFHGAAIGADHLRGDLPTE